MRRPILLVAFVAVAFVMVSVTAGYRVLRVRTTAGNPTGELVFTRQVEVSKVTSEDGIVSLGTPLEDLYVVGVDGSHRRLLARNAADAAVSPDGRRIAFTRGRAVWIMQRDGSQGKRLARAASDPAWSPDGKTIYFSRWVEADLGISLFSIRDDGTHARPVDASAGGGGLGPEPASRLLAVSPGPVTVARWALGCVYRRPQRLRGFEPHPRRLARGSAAATAVPAAPRHQGHGHGERHVCGGLEPRRAAVRVRRLVLKPIRSRPLHLTVGQITNTTDRRRCRHSSVVT